jgi:haloalkane dehalogenase
MQARQILKKEYPFASHWLEFGGLKLHYLDEGPREAPPVLMLHGNPTWSFYYRKLVLALRDRFRCIVPDHIGCGLSDKPDDDVYDYRLASRIEELDRLVKHLQLSAPLTLVVHDWGGMIGFGWARNNPRAISRMVIMNTAAFPLPENKRLPLALGFTRNTALGAFLVRRFNAFAGVAARVAFKKPVEPGVRKAYTAPYDSWANRIATLRFVQDIPVHPGDPGFDILADTAEHLPLFKNVPCLIAWGEKDFVFNEAFLNRWLEFYPDARVYRFPDCGHYVLEDAGPELVPAIRDFVDIKEESNHEHI